MKFSLKKLIVAASAVVAALSINTVTAMASTDLWVYGDTSVPEVYGMAADQTKSLTCETGKNIGFTDKIFTTESGGTTGECSGRKGLSMRDQDLNGNSDTNTRYSVYFKPTKTGTVNLYVARTGSNTGTLKFYTAKYENGTYSRTGTINSGITIGGRKHPDATTTTNNDLSATQISVEKGQEYLLYTDSSNVILYGMTFDAATGTVYDEDSFGAYSENPTALVPGDTASSSLTFADVENLANPTYDADGIANLSEPYTVGVFKLVSASDRMSKLFSSNGTQLIRSAGSTNNKGRYIEFTAKAGDVVKLTDVQSSSTDAPERTCLLATSVTTDTSKAIKTYTTNGDVQDVLFPITADGTYYICFAASIDFSGVYMYQGVEVAAPAISLTQLASTDTKVQFKGVISGSADDSVPVTAINVVTAKGYEVSGDIAYTAKSHSIAAVAAEGSDYAFIVTIDKSAVDALPGLKVQANVVYDVSGSAFTSYSDVVDYAA